MYELMSNRGASTVPLSVCAIAIQFLLGCASDRPDELSNFAGSLSAAPPEATKPDEPSSSAESLPSAPPESTKRRRLDPGWNKHMRETLPGEGCFRATPPDNVWHQVPCGTAPRIPLAPAIVGGGGGDFMVNASGLLTGAWGSFPTVSGPGYIGTNGDLTLQVNSNPFVTPMCNASPNPNCLGWQQFIAYGSQGVGGPASYYTYVFMQYWLLGYNAACPLGWTSFTDTGACPGNCCWTNSNSADGGEYPLWSYLPDIEVSGQVLNGGLQDAVGYWDGFSYYASVNGEGQMQLSQGWRSAEFNIFGYGNGAQVNFPLGTTMLVRLGILDGTSAAPTCAFGSTTAETNNLNLVPSSCCATGGANNLAITFLQSNASLPPTSGFCLLNLAIPTILGPVL